MAVWLNGCLVSHLVFAKIEQFARAGRHLQIDAKLERIHELKFH